MMFHFLAQLFMTAWTNPKIDKMLQNTSRSTCRLLHIFPQLTPLQLLLTSSKIIKFSLLKPPEPVHVISPHVTWLDIWLTSISSKKNCIFSWPSAHSHSICYRCNLILLSSAHTLSFLNVRGRILTQMMSFFLKKICTRTHSQNWVSRRLTYCQIFCRWCTSCALAYQRKGNGEMSQ